MGFKVDSLSRVSPSRPTVPTCFSTREWSSRRKMARTSTSTFLQIYSRYPAGCNLIALSFLTFFILKCWNTYSVFIFSTQWIWQDNMQFLQDKNIFEHTYFGSVTHFCTSHHDCAFSEARMQMWYYSERMLRVLCLCARDLTLKCITKSILLMKYWLN